MRHLTTTGSVLACTAMLMVGAQGAYAAKEKFVRSKPHVNVSGPHRVSNEIVTVGIGVVEPGTIGIGVPSDKPCTGEVDLRIEEAATGAPLASRTAVRLTSGMFELASYPSPSASISVRVVIVARDMEVDGKECVLRGEIEFQDIASGQTTRRIPVRRQDFVKP